MATDLEKLRSDREAELVRHTKSLEVIDKKITGQEEAEFKRIQQEAQALGIHIVQAPRRKKNENRKSQTCSVCGKVGITSTDHNARTHSNWLATEATQAQKNKFKK